MPLPIQGPFRHRWKRMRQRRQCVWCKQQAQQAQQAQRPALAEITNIASQGVQQGAASRSLGGCRLCNVYLCLKSACFESYHQQK